MQTFSYIKSSNIIVNKTLQCNTNIFYVPVVDKNGYHIIGPRCEIFLGIYKKIFDIFGIGDLCGVLCMCISHTSDRLRSNSEGLTNCSINFFSIFGNMWVSRRNIWDASTTRSEITREWFKWMMYGQKHITLRH
jgi:hypothetical protein